MKSIATTILMLGIFQTLDAQDVVNIYSARHYDTDDKLYDQFEKKTGIKVQVIEGSSDAQKQASELFIEIEGRQKLK